LRNSAVWASEPVLASGGMTVIPCGSDLSAVLHAVLQSKRVYILLTEGKYPGQIQFTRTPRFRLANSAACMWESEIVAALETVSVRISHTHGAAQAGKTHLDALYPNWPRWDVLVIPDMELRLTMFPGSGYPPTDLAAARRGRKANVVKWYDAQLMR
jgi:hypothetical protein